MGEDCFLILTFTIRMLGLLHRWEAESAKVPGSESPCVPHNLCTLRTGKRGCVLGGFSAGHGFSS